MTTTGEILVWNEPARHVQDMLALGVNTFVGPEPEDKKHLTPEQFAKKSREWIDAVANSDAKCILREPWRYLADGETLPANCVGIIHSIDEPAGHGIPPSGLQAETDRISAAYPGVRIFLTHAGDKITDIKPTNADYAAKVALYKAYAAAIKNGTTEGVQIVDWYTKNRNATRYPITYTSDAVKWLSAITSPTPVYVWLDANDQMLPPPTSMTDGVHLDVNREPTPDEETQTADNCVAAGAQGLGFFLTCDSGKYGWSWQLPKGDSYYPQVNRAGVSMAPQYDAMRAIAAKYGKPVDDVNARVADLEAQVETLTKSTADANATADKAAKEAKAAHDRIDAMISAGMTPPTPPTP